MNPLLKHFGKGLTHDTDYGMNDPLSIISLTQAGAPIITNRIFLFDEVK